jgi:transposase InsO family protein
MAKCAFFKEELEYLGHFISKEGIRKDPRKVIAVVNARQPRNRTELRGFLGKVNYYAKFIPDLSSHARPLAKITSEMVEFKWGPAQEEAFQKLKILIAQEVTLAFPVDGLPFTITSDASNYAVGAYLSQTDPETKKERPIMFLSKALDPAQSKYSTTEKELLAVVYALDRFRPYVYGRKFRCVTDHRSLLWLCGKRNPSSRLARWCQLINSYTNDIQFVKGKNNRVADALSRAPFVEEPEKDPNLTTEEDQFNANLELDESIKEQIYRLAGITNLHRFQEHQQNPPNLDQPEISNCHLLTTAEHHHDSNLHETNLPSRQTTNPYQPTMLPEIWAQETNEEDPSTYKDHTGLWRIKKRIGYSTDEEIELLWVPPLYRRDVLRSFHQGPGAAHSAGSAMLHRLKKEVWWKQGHQDVQEYVKRCGKCQLFRPAGRDKVHLQSRGSPSYPMERISMDVLSLEGIPGSRNPLLLVIIDEFTRYPEVFPMRDQKASTIAEIFLKKFIPRYSVPRELLSDRGANFLSQLMMAICERLKIRKLNTTAYHPEANGANERSHRTLYTLLRGLTEDNGSDWEEKLPMALWAYRVAYHRSIGTSPHEALFGFHPRNIEIDHPDEWDDLRMDERLRNMEAMQTRMKELQKQTTAKRNAAINDTRKEPSTLEPGDLVKVRKQVRTKLDPHWEGPFEVLRQVGPVTYEIKLSPQSRRHPIIHRTHLAPWYEDRHPEDPEENEPRQLESPIPDSDEDDFPDNTPSSPGSPIATPAPTKNVPPPPPTQLPQRPVTRAYNLKHHLPLFPLLP